MGWKLLFSLPSPCPTLITFALVIPKIDFICELSSRDCILLKLKRCAPRNLSSLTRGVTLGIQIQIRGFVRSPSLPLLTRSAAAAARGQFSWWLGIAYKFHKAEEGKVTILQ